MAIDDRARHELYLRAEAAMGSESAETLMNLLPPVGWADVATKQDLAHGESLLGSRIDALERRVDLRFDQSEQRILQTMTWRMAQMLLAVVGILLAVIVPFVS